MLKKWVAFLILSVAFCQTFADSRADIEKRIKPIGQVQIQGDDSTKIKDEQAEAPKAQKAVAKVTGESTYKTYCVTCHAAGVAGAPKAHDKAAWAPRQKQGLETLLKHAKSGIKAMPPKGTCMSCTDEQLMDAIKFMLPK